MAKENENNEINKTSVMPNNLEAEQALLGCLLIDIDTQTDILDKLTEEDFYQESHKLIIGAMKRVFNERKPRRSRNAVRRTGKFAIAGQGGRAHLYHGSCETDPFGCELQILSGHRQARQRE